MDPQKTKDGKPYGPFKYKQLNKECYYISKSSGYSYFEILEMTPMQRHYIREFIQEENESNKKTIEKINENNKNVNSLRTKK